jgi:integrase
MAIHRRKTKRRGKVVREALYTARFMFRGKLYRRGGFASREAAQHWIDTTRTAIRNGEVGYVPLRNAARLLPLVDEFIEHLDAQKVSPLYSYNCQKRLTRLARECPWVTLADFKAQSFEAWRATRPKWHKRTLGDRTLDQYLDTAREFGNWLVGRRMLAKNPMADALPLKPGINERYRRAASVEELQRLLDTAPPARATFYRFLLYVPLRKRAYAGLEWRDVNLAGERPTLTVRAELSKSGRTARVAIRRDLATDLAALRGDAADRDRVFPAPPTLDELRADLEAAGVQFADAEGQRRFDFHAFRKTAIRLLKRSGVSMDQAHVFLQHRDRRTTERYYDDDMVEPEISDAAEQMPELKKKGPK